MIKKWFYLLILLFYLPLMFFTSPVFPANKDSAHLWTISVNPDLQRDNMIIYGLWRQKGKLESDLFFGIFDDKTTLSKALEAIKKIDPTASPMPLLEKPIPDFLPVTKRITLKELGYQTPVYIWGTRGQRSIHIPWSQISLLRGAKIFFYIRFPKGVFRKPSLLTVYVENIPVRTIPLDQPLLQPVEIPLDDLQKVNIGNFLDIKVSTFLTITGDICVDDRSGNAWVMLEPFSYFQISSISALRGLRDTLQNPLNRFNIILPKKLGAEILTGLVNITSLIGSFHPYERKSLINIGNVYSLQYPNIIIRKMEEDCKIVGRDIFVSPENIHNLIKSFQIAPLNFSTWESVQVKKDESNNSDLVVSFSSLGIYPPALKGIGDMSFSVPFSVATFGRFPSKIVATIIYSHTPVVKNEKAFMKIRFNGNLIASKLLTGSAENYSFSFELPSRQIQTTNNLEVITSYFPDRGECRGSFPEMEVQVSPDSFLTIIGKGSLEPVQFDRFPGFLNGKGLLVVGNYSPSLVGSAVKLAEKLGKLRRYPILLKVINLDKFSPEIQDYPFIIGILEASQTMVFNPPVDISEAFSIINPLTNKVILKVGTDDSLAIWEVFQLRNNIVAGIFAVSERIAASELPLKLLDELLIQGGANVALWSEGFSPPSEIIWQSFQIGNKLKVVTLGKKGFYYYWVRYRIVFFVGLGLIVFLFLWYVYRKLT